MTASDPVVAAHIPRSARPEARTNLFSTVLDAMTDGVMVVDDALRLVITNRALRDTLLLPPAPAGKPLRALVADANLLAAFERVLHGAGPQQVELVHRGLQTRLLDILVVPLPDHEYWGHRALGVVRDVTDRRELERLLMDFIANASHELRTPTTAILGWAETLVDAPPRDPAKGHEIAQTIHRHAQRMATLLEQLLDVCRLDQQRWQFDPHPVEVANLLQDAALQMAEASNAAGLSVTVHCPASVQGLVCDRHALQVVVSNLLQNAIKYTPTGGRIELRAQLQADPGPLAVRLSVVDSGIGIAAADQTRIFERFYRVDKGRTRHVGGAGLGLAIVLQLVKQLGGTLEVQSAVGKGSTFSVMVPLAPN